MLHGQPITNPHLPGTIIVGVGIIFGWALQLLSIIFGVISIFTSKGNTDIFKWPAIVGTTLSLSLFSVLLFVEIVGLILKH
jgi:hypothetical protein